MPNSVLSQITLPSGTTYDLKDAKARQDIADLQSIATGAMHYIGISSTAITDGGTQKPTIDNVQKTMTADDAGAVCIYGEKEYVWNGSKWQEFGSTGSLKALAFKDSASGNFTPAGTVSQPSFTGSSSNVTITATDNTSGNYQPKGTVSQPTFTGSSSNVTITSAANASGNYQPAGTVSQPTFSNGSVSVTASYTPAGTVTVEADEVTWTPTPVDVQAYVPGESGGAYTPAGTISTPTISLASAGSTTTVNSITAVGTLPSWSGTVSGETLTIGWSAGTLPTKGSNTTVKTGDPTYTSSQPTFTGTKVSMSVDVYAVDTYSGTFTGTPATISSTGTATGTVSQPTFTGTKVQLSGTTTAAGSVSQPTFSGTKVQLAGTTTAAGSVSQPTFTGTQGTVTVS